MKPSASAMPLPFRIRHAAVACLVMLAGAPHSRGAPFELEAAEEGRELHVGDTRTDEIRRDVTAALREKLGAKMESVELDLPRPRVVRTGDAIEVVFDRGCIDLVGLDVSGIAIRGRVRFENLRLDYGSLGLRRFALTAPPRVFPDLETSLENVNNYLAAQGFKDTFVRQAEGSEGIVFGGRRPVRILMVRTNPSVSIQGKFTLAGSILGFEIQRVDVENTSGAVASAIQRRVRSEASRTIDLTSLFEGFEVRGIEVRDGSLRVMSGREALLAQRLSGAPPAQAG